MLDRFREFIKKNNLFSHKDKILLGFSGGPDSVVLAHLFVRMGISIALAHVNFQLRGKESDEDQQFSRLFAQKYNLDFFTTNFDTISYSKEKRLSIEEAARELRYNWFASLSQKHNFDYIATAHNADDNIETILFNLARGTGIKGLLGIPVKRENIVRPLLFAYKKEVLFYCRENNLEYRFDKTNDDIKISRNRLRHKIIPEFEQLNLAFKDNVLKSAENLKLVYNLVSEYVDNCLLDIIKNKGNEILFNKLAFEKCKHKELILYEFLSSMGFSVGEIKSFKQFLSSQPGKLMISKKYIAINDREKVIFVYRESWHRETQLFFLEPESSFIDLGDFGLKIEILKREQIRDLKQGEKIALLDFDLLKFPLTIRHWRNGDYFYPLGMGGKKKLSDFFTDKKLSLIDKKNIMVVESDGKIVWIIGMRIDNRFKITSKTQKVIKLIVNEKD